MLHIQNILLHTRLFTETVAWSNLRLSGVKLKNLMHRANTKNIKPELSRTQHVYGTMCFLFLKN